MNMVNNLTGADQKEKENGEDQGEEKDDIGREHEGGEKEEDNGNDVDPLENQTSKPSTT